MIARQLASTNTDSTLFKDAQSGLSHASEKTIASAPFMQDIARHGRYITSKSAEAMRKFAQPLERSFAKLSGKNREILHRTIIEEMNLRRQFSDSELMAKGFDQKTMAAYKHFRAEDDRAYDTQNAVRVAQGKKPLTRQEAHSASRWSGDYHIQVKDKDGKTVWYVQSPTKWHGESALEWLKNDLKSDPNIDVSNLKVEYNPRNNFGDIPRDTLGVYHDMLEAFKDDPNVKIIQESLKSYIDAQSNRALRQDLHQVNTKMNVRGFQGDQPWMSERKNANDWMQAQVRYIENAHKWAAIQESMGEIKKLMENPEIAAAQPHNMAIAKQYLLKYMGMDQSLTKGLEAYFGEKTGLSSSAIRTSVATAKGLGYAGTLALSPGYALATIAQPVAGSLAWFAKLANEGYVNQGQ